MDRLQVFSDIDHYIDSSELEKNQIPGSYKLSKSIINRLMPAKIELITYRDGHKNITILPNVTDSELLMLLYLSHICDSTGLAHAVNYHELVDDIGITIKSYYNALNGLIQKQYISCKKINRGHYDIRILNNDFSSKSKGKSKKQPYVNTNRDMFIPHTLAYTTFKNLSLNSKKTLLHILNNCNIYKGMRFYTHTLAKHLGVNKNRIHRYLNQCVGLLGNFYSRRITNKGVVVCIHPKNYNLLSNNSIYETQITYQKRQFIRFIKDSGIEVFYNDYQPKKQQLHDYLTKLYNMYYVHSPILGAYRVLRLIYQLMSYYHSLDPWRIKLIRTYVQKLAKKKKEQLTIA